MKPEAQRDVLVLGNGGFGTAMAVVLRGAGYRVRVWGIDPDYIREIEERRQNRKFLPGVAIPEGVRFISEIDEAAAEARTIVSAVPTQFLRKTLQGLRERLFQGALVVSCSKGFECSTLELPSRVIRQILPRARVAVLSGPSHAEEIGRRLPTTVVTAAEDPAVARAAQSAVSAPWFRVYTSPDPLGVEVAGASKNVIALAAGISDGLGYGDNAEAGLICRGASEITRLGVALGARRETFGGLSGIGDLVATCTSRHSRNRSVGLRLGRGESLDAILRSSETVAEGVETTRSLEELSRKLSVELPITAEVHAVLFEGKDPRRAVADLMSRQAKGEID